MVLEKISSLLLPPPSFDLRRMEFLREQPVVSLTDGESKTFVADIFQPCPDFDHTKR